MKQYTEEQKRVINSIDIKKYIPKAALYEQLAEEASELSQAALKYARYIRKENYTNKTQSECEECIREEFSDVINCANVLGLQYSEEIIDYKLFRWKQRIYEYSSIYNKRR